MKHLFYSRGEKNILFTLIFIGLLLRLWGIRQNLPYNYYGDESYLIYHSLKFGTGDLNPHWFVWPTLFQYMLFFFFGIFYIVGLIFGRFKNVSDFLFLYFKDPTIFFVIGRIAASIFGTASIALIYLIAKKSYNKITGIIAASLFAFLPLSVEYSHYAVVDTPLVFMVLLSFIFIINILLYGRLRDYLCSGFFSGLAIGTKYPAVFLVLPIFFGHLFTCHKKVFLKTIFDQKIILCFLFIFLGFFLACPFAILDFPKFFSDIKGQILCAKIGWFGWEKVNSYIYHLTQNLKDAMGLPLLIFSIISIVYAMIQREKIALILLSFPIIYFLFIGLDKNPYARFMLPVLPFLMIFSGKLLLDLRGVLNKQYRSPKIVFYGFLAFLLLYPLYTTIKTDLVFSLSNTMTLAKEWVEKNIPAGSRVLLNEPGPPLLQNPDWIKRDANSKPEGQLRYGYHKQRDFFYKIKEKVAAQNITYRLNYISSPIGYLEGEYGYEKIMLKTQEAIKDYKEKYDFIIVTGVMLDKLIEYPKESIPKRYWSLRDFYENIFNNYQPIKEFLAQDNLSKGPTIRIYKLR